MNQHDPICRIHLSLAWPIWAGGYPTADEGLHWLNEALPEIKKRFAVILHGVLGREYVILSDWTGIGGFQPMRGLFFGMPQPNSVDLSVVVGCDADYASDAHTLPDGIERVRREFVDQLEATARADMPNASAGANLYEVIGRSDVAPGLKYAIAPNDIRHERSGARERTLTAPFDDLFGTRRGAGQPKAVPTLSAILDLWSLRPPVTAWFNTWPAPPRGVQNRGGWSVSGWLGAWPEPRSHQR